MKSMATGIARGLVSKEKRRYVDKENGFDLDLSYITETIMAMGIPSEGTEGLFRNPMSEVIRFFNLQHNGTAKIYNLCLEDSRQYDPEMFSGATASFPFEDHNVCMFTMLPAFTKSAKEWLRSGPDQVVAVHCKAGKSRTGLMICALLMYIGEGPAPQDPEATMAFYARARTNDGKGVTIPSQRRFITYYRTCLNVGTASGSREPEMPKPRKLKVLRMRLLDMPQKTMDKLDEVVWDFSVYPSSNLMRSWENPMPHVSKSTVTETLRDVDCDRWGFTADSAGGPMEGYTSTEHTLRCATWDFELDVEEEFRVWFHEMHEGKRKKLFYFWLHTSFMPGGAQEFASKDYYYTRREAPDGTVVLQMNKLQLDKFGKKKSFPGAFTVEITLWDPAQGARPDLPMYDAAHHAEAAQMTPELSAEETAHRRLGHLSAIAGSRKPEALAEEIAENGEYIDLACSLCVEFLRPTISATRLPAIQGEESWGSYKVENLLLASITTDVKGASRLGDGGESGGLKIAIGGITAKLGTFDWTFDKTSFPKMADSGHADAVFDDMTAEVYFGVLSSDGTRVAVTKQAYTSEKPEDLSYSAGDEIVVVKEDGRGWWVGTLKGVCGLFDPEQADVKSTGAPKRFVVLDELSVSLSTGKIAAKIHQQDGTNKAKKWVYNKLLSIFNERIREQLELEIVAEIRKGQSKLCEKLEAAANALIAEAGDPSLHTATSACVESGSDSDDEEVPRMGSMAAASASVPTDAQRDITSPTDGVYYGAMSDATLLEKWQVCTLCPAVPCLCATVILTLLCSMATRSPEKKLSRGKRRKRWLPQAATRRRRSTACKPRTARLRRLALSQYTHT